jgi:hypothetical protein
LSLKNTATEYDRTTGIKWLSCTEKRQSDITLSPPSCSSTPTTTPSAAPARHPAVFWPPNPPPPPRPAALPPPGGAHTPGEGVRAPPPLVANEALPSCGAPAARLPAAARLRVSVLLRPVPLPISCRLCLCPCSLCVWGGGAAHHLVAGGRDLREDLAVPGALRHAEPRELPCVWAYRDRSLEKD